MSVQAYIMYLGMVPPTLSQVVLCQHMLSLVAIAGVEQLLTYRSTVLRMLLLVVTEGVEQHHICNIQCRMNAQEQCMFWGTASHILVVCIVSLAVTVAVALDRPLEATVAAGQQCTLQVLIAAVA